MLFLFFLFRFFFECVIRIPSIAPSAILLFLTALSAAEMVLYHTQQNVEVYNRRPDIEVAMSVRVVSPEPFAEVHPTDFILVEVQGVEISEGAHQELHSNQTRCFSQAARPLWSCLTDIWMSENDILIQTYRFVRLRRFFQMRLCLPDFRVCLAFSASVYIKSGDWCC